MEGLEFWMRDGSLLIYDRKPTLSLEAKMIEITHRERADSASKQKYSHLVFETDTVQVGDGGKFYEPKLLFMNRLFWKDIHHLLGLPVPSAYNFSARRAASSCRACVKYPRRYSFSQ